MIQYVARMTSRTSRRVTLDAHVPMILQGQRYFTENLLTLTVLVATIDAQWKGMGDVGSARYELATYFPHARP